MGPTAARRGEPIASPRCRPRRPIRALRADRARHPPRGGTGGARAPWPGWRAEGRPRRRGLDGGALRGAQRRGALPHALGPLVPDAGGGVRGGARAARHPGQGRELQPAEPTPGAGRGGPAAAAGSGRGGAGGARGLPGTPRGALCCSAL